MAAILGGGALRCAVVCRGSRSALRPRMLLCQQPLLRAAATTTPVTRAVVDEKAVSASSSSSSSSLLCVVGLANELSKAKLSGFVAITAFAGYAASGAPLLYDAAGFLEPGAAFATAGVFACSASANACNQIYERHRDGLMHRTKRRPLPSGRCSVTFASSFAVVAGASGAASLAASGFAVPALLGVGNIFLYAGIYTPMKQTSEWNTWAGAVVGAVPPLIGWTAAGSGLAEAQDPYILASLLYLWQFPHFFALAWRHKKDYMRGGYAMVACDDAGGSRTAKLISNYALYATALPIIAVASGATSPMFAVEGTALNALLLYTSKKFSDDRSTANAASVFRVTLAYLPLLLLCFLLHSTRLKKKSNDEANDALGPVRNLGYQYCAHELIAQARSLTPSFCPFDCTLTAAPTKNSGDKKNIEKAASSS